MMHTKFTAAFISLSTAIVLFWPVTENLKKKPVDRFPLSYYPMFSHARGTGNTLNYIVGYSKTGMRSYIPYKYIASGGFNQVRRQLNKIVKTKRGSEFLDAVATRMKKKYSAFYNRFTTIEIVRGTFDFDSYYLQNNKKLKEEIILYTKNLN